MTVSSVTCVGEGRIKLKSKGEEGQKGKKQSCLMVYQGRINQRRMDRIGSETFTLRSPHVSIASMHVMTVYKEIVGLACCRVLQINQSYNIPVSRRTPYAQWWEHVSMVNGQSRVLIQCV